MKRTIFILLILLLAVGMLFAEGQRESEKVLKVLIGGHAIEEADAWEYIISTFENKHGVDVDYELIGFEGYRDKLVTSFSAGIPLDVVLCNLIGDTGDFASRGWLEPIDERLAGWEGTDQIWEKNWEAVTYKGKRYGIPWFTDARLLLYNYELFEKAGLDPKKPPKTWEELVDYAVKLTDPDKGIYGYGVSGNASLINTCGYYVFVLSNGGQVLSDDYSEAMINSKEAVEALKFYTDLYTKYKVSPPGTLSMGEDEYRTLMAQGKIAMAIGGPWSIPLIEMANPDIKGKYGFAPHPANEGKKSGTFFGGWYFAMGSKSQNKDLAWEFLTHVTSYDTWMYWAGRYGGPLPTRKDVIRDAAVYKADPWPAIIDGFKGAHSVEPIKPIFTIWTELYTMVQQVLLEELTAEEAAEIYKVKIDKIIKEQM